MIRELREEKKILTGGPISGTIGSAMIVEAASPLELDGIVESVPVWLLMETSVAPLTTFEDRIRAISPRLERAKADAHRQRTADLWPGRLKCRGKLFPVGSRRLQMSGSDCWMSGNI